MLEDGPVTEEQKEVEKINKNDMETKEMTFNEAQAFLEGVKFICKSKEERDNVLSKLNTLGVCVVDTKTEYAYMFTIDNDNYLRHTISIVDWIVYEEKVIEPSEILSIKIKEEPKPKFDPGTLQPFDKILVRDDEDDNWRCALFSHIDKEATEYIFTCISHNWGKCIPYNDDTKYLVGTAEDAPEFYRL